MYVCMYVCLSVWMDGYILDSPPTPCLSDMDTHGCPRRHLIFTKNTHLHFLDFQLVYPNSPVPNCHFWCEPSKKWPQASFDWFVLTKCYTFRNCMMPNTKVWAKCFFGEVQILRILPYHPGCPPPQKKILCPKFGVWHHSLSKITWLWKYKSIKSSLGSFFLRLTWFGTGLHYFAPFKAKLSTFHHFFQ